MCKIKKYIIFLVIVLCLSGCQNIAEDEIDVETEQTIDVETEQTTSMEQEKIIEDIQVIKQTISSSPCSKNYHQDDFELLIDEIKTGKIDREVCYQRLREIISSYHCAHLSIWTKPNDPIYTNRLPILLTWFGEELRVTACSEEYIGYMGMKVLSISDYSINDVLEKYGSINSYETQRGRMTFLEQPMWECDLVYLDLLDSNQHGVEFEVENEQGNIENFDVELVSWDECNLIYLEDVYCEQEEMSISYRNKSNGLNYCFEADSEHDIMYFLYTQCAEMEDYSLEQCFEDMMDELNANPSYDEIVFDVRWNQGGNRFIMLPLLERYKDELAQKKISIIVGKSTYSAAFQFVEDCLQLFDEVFIYGEETGQAINNYTEVNMIDLPALNCGMSVPTVKDYLPELEKRYEDLERGIIPDEEIYQTYEDYLKGVDTIYEFIKK